MATEWLSGFAYLASANIPEVWTTFTGSVGASLIIDSSPPAGRIGPALKMTNASVGKTVLPKGAWTVGFAFNLNNANFFAELFLSQHAGGLLFRIRLESDGTISMYAGTNANPGTLIFNSSTVGFAIHVNTWYYLESTFSFSGTTNIAVTAELKINTNVLGSGTKNSGIDVANLLNGTATTNYHIWESNILGSLWIKDLYLNDTAGGDPGNGYMGDVTFGVIVPNGDVTTDWTATGSPAYAQVNEIPPNGDSTYIQSGTPAAVENFDWQDVSITGAIQAVQYLVYARKTAEGTKSIKQTVGPTGGFEQLSPKWFLSDNFVYYHFAMNLDPGTSLQWTQAGLNAKKFGVEVIL